MLNKTCFALILLTVISAAFAQNVVVTKEAPASIKFGNTLNVSITVANDMGTPVTADVREALGNAQAISPQIVSPVNTEGVLVALPPYFAWTLQIDANSQKTVTYTIKPNNVGYYLFSPTTVRTESDVFYSNVLSTLVECNLNGVCEPQYGEDDIFCKADCSQHVSPGSENDTTDDATAVNTGLTNGTGISPPANIDLVMLVGAAIFVLAAFLFYAFRMAGKSEGLFN